MVGIGQRGGLRPVENFKQEVVSDQFLKALSEYFVMSRLTEKRSKRIVCVYIYIHTQTYTCTYMCIYTYI